MGKDGQRWSKETEQQEWTGSGQNQIDRGEEIDIYRFDFADFHSPLLRGNVVDRPPDLTSRVSLVGPTVEGPLIS